MIDRHSTNTPAPQASASTNSAIRAKDSVVDGISQENGSTSRDELHGEKFPTNDIPTKDRAGEAGNGTTARMPPSAKKVRAFELEVRGQRNIVRARAAGSVLPANMVGRCIEIDVRTLASGVYFLLLGSDVVYIGSSVGVAGRICTHVRDRIKRFDRAIFMPCDEDERLDIEGALIRLFQPVHNGNAPKYVGRDSKILRRLGLPKMDPELRRLFRMKEKLERMRDERRVWNETSLRERVEIYGDYVEPGKWFRQPRKAKP